MPGLPTVSVPLATLTEPRMFPPGERAIEPPVAVTSPPIVPLPAEHGRVLQRDVAVRAEQPVDASPPPVIVVVPE